MMKNFIFIIRSNTDRLQGLDRLYAYVSQRAAYPFVLFNALAMTWVVGGFAVISISFTNARPGEFVCSFLGALRRFFKF